MSAAPKAAPRIALLGATGLVGQELLAVLEERRLSVGELLPLAGEGSAGVELELRGDLLDVEPLVADKLPEVDLLLCAAPAALEPLLPRLGETRVVDVSGSLELDPGVPLHLLGADDVPPGARRVAIPRGVAGGLSLALGPLARQPGLRRVSVVTLEPAAGAGREAAAELSDQTVALLNSMTGEAGAPVHFPLPLAFDCLPLVGLLLEEGTTSEEQRLRHVVRRGLRQPGLALEVTRVRVPVFAGSLAAVHVELEGPAPLERLREAWEASPALELRDAEDLPTSRASLGLDRVLLGRVRLDGDRLAFVLALDDLRAGAALPAIEAAEALLREP